MNGWVSARAPRCLARIVVLTLVFCLLEPKAALGQDDAQLMDRPIAAVQLTGLQRITEQEVRNNIRAQVGSPYDPEMIRGDVRRLEALGLFRYVDVFAELRDDGTVDLTYALTEQPLIREVQTVDNKLITDQALLAVVPLLRGGPRDDFLIETAKRNIQDLYRNRGHYLTTVEVDESELDETGILIFRIIEGPRVKVRAIEFEGNEAISAKQLRSQVDTKTAVPIFEKGALDEDQLDEDVASLDAYYKDRGYLDVRVDRRIELSPDNREAKVVFLVREGAVYTLGTIQVRRLPDGSEPTVYASQQLMAILEIRQGDVYSQDKVRKSVRAVEDAYGLLGYHGVVVQTFELRQPDRPVVDLALDINEGQFVMVGMVRILGNFLTKDKIIRRETELRPNRPLDGTEISHTKERLRTTRLFGRPIGVTVQSADPMDNLYRDVLIEIKEQNTGSVNFGIAVGSDSGVFGEISVDQRNFDIADMPESFEELIRGRAFRGAGQRFQMVFRPGDEIFQYSVSVTEPNLFESEYSLRIGGSFFRRVFQDFDEQRISAEFGISRKLGDIWVASLNGRVSEVRLENIERDAPTEIFADAGPDMLTGLSLSLTRTTITTIRRPGRGSQLELAYERVGALGGDFQFNKIGGEYTVFLTLYEDFLERKTTLRLNTRAAYAFGDDRPPTYEQYYLGGRSLRGLDFREVSPKGIRADNGAVSDEAVGGEWLFFAGAQLEHPLLEETVTGVLFVDSGTVLDEVSFDKYRLSVGVGLRLYIEQFGPLPIAFDFGFPLLKEDEDEEQLFSFSAEIPF